MSLVNDIFGTAAWAQAQAQAQVSDAYANSEAWQRAFDHRNVQLDIRCSPPPEQTGNPWRDADTDPVPADKVVTFWHPQGGLSVMKAPVEVGPGVYWRLA